MNTGKNCALHVSQFNHITKEELRENFGWDPKTSTAIENEAAKIITSGLINTELLTTVDGRKLEGRDAFNQMIVDLLNAGEDLNYRKAVAYGSKEGIEEMRKNGLYKDYDDLIERMSNNAKLRKDNMAYLAVRLKEAHDSFKKASKDPTIFQLDQMRRNISDPNMHMQDALTEGIRLRQQNKAEVYKLNAITNELIADIKKENLDFAYEYMINKWNRAFAVKNNDVDTIAELDADAEAMRKHAKEIGVDLDDIVRRFDNINAYGFVLEADAAIEYFAAAKQMFAGDEKNLKEIKVSERLALRAFFGEENVDAVLKHGSFSSFLAREKMTTAADYFGYLKGLDDKTIFREGYVPNRRRVPTTDPKEKTVPEMFADISLDKKPEDIMSDIIALRKNVVEKYMKKETRKQLSEGPEVSGYSEQGWALHNASYQDLFNAAAARIGTKYQKADFMHGLRVLGEYSKNIVEGNAAMNAKDLQRILDVYSHNFKSSSAFNQISQMLRATTALKQIGFSAPLGIKQYFQIIHPIMSVGRRVMKGQDIDTKNLPPEFVKEILDYRDGMIKGLLETDITMSQEDFLTRQQLDAINKDLVDEHSYQWRVNKGLQKAMTKAMGWSPLDIIPLVRDLPFTNFVKADKHGKTKVINATYAYHVNRMAQLVDWKADNMSDTAARSAAVNRIKKAAMQEAMRVAESTLGGTGTTGSDLGRHPVWSILLQYKTTYWPQFTDSTKQWWRRLSVSESSAIEKVTRSMLQKVGIPVNSYGRTFDMLAVGGLSVGLTYFLAQVLGSNGTDYMNAPPLEIVADLMDDDKETQEKIKRQFAPPVWGMIKDIGLAFSAYTEGSGQDSATEEALMKLMPSQGRRTAYSLKNAYRSAKQKKGKLGVDVIKGLASTFTGFYLRNRDHGGGGYRSPDKEERDRFYALVEQNRASGMRYAEAFDEARRNFGGFTKLPDYVTKQAAKMRQISQLQTAADQLREMYQIRRAQGAPQSELKKIWAERERVYKKINALYGNKNKAKPDKPEAVFQYPATNYEYKPLFEEDHYNIFNNNDLKQEA